MAGEGHLRLEENVTVLSSETKPGMRLWIEGRESSYEECDTVEFENPATFVDAFLINTFSSPRVVVG